LKTFLRYQLPPLLWIVITFVLAYVPDLFVSIRLPVGAEEIVHAGVIFVLCWLVQRAFRHQKIMPELKRNSFLGAFIFSLVYGILGMFHLSNRSGYSPGLYDLLAGIGGALLYVAIASMLSNGDDGDRSESEG
jgi:hypothetical protein